MCAAFYASCLYAQKAIAVMAKSDDNDNYRHNVISSHLLVWALVWLTLSPGSLRYFLAPGEITSTETTETHLEIPILSTAMIVMMIIIFTTTMISSVRQRVPEWKLRNPKPVLWWWAGGASLHQIQLIDASSHCDFWCVWTWNTTYEGMIASKH